jgi:hypothetical protein
MDGIFLGHNLLLSQASFSLTEFWLSQSLSHKVFSFSRWNFGYHGAFLTNSFFFHDGISAITEPFSRILFFFHDGISAITEPFSRILSFFTMELRLSRSLSYEFFLFSRWNFDYHGAFLTNSFFFTMELRLSRSLSHEFFLFSPKHSGNFFAPFFYEVLPHYLKLLPHFEYMHEITPNLSKEF